MKKIILIFILVSVNVVVQAQDKSKVFSTTEMVWYGLDFSNAKFVGQFDQGFGAMPATGADMRAMWVPEWNTLIVKEQKHYDLKKAFDVDKIYYDIQPVNNVNSKMDSKNCMSLNAGSLDKSDIERMVNRYPAGEKKEGVGCVFIIENFNKLLGSASIFVTCFDIATKKVLLCERMEGKPMGGGMRNYWAGAIKDVLKDMSQFSWKKWKNK